MIRILWPGAFAVSVHPISITGVLASPIRYTELYPLPPDDIRCNGFFGYEYRAVEINFLISFFEFGSRM